MPSSTARYEQLPTDDEPQSPHSPSSPASHVHPPAYDFNIEDARPRLPVFPIDPRFHQPTPSPFSRAALLLFLGFYAHVLRS
ncbi:hypothetical protein H0H81_009036 [Sphagnurus paluster]|uniref:Uncharacterized protein n=1 Tax=Sphagnurus paluster TaxID=117069 RepID=A0A9P7FPW3_9AGAR|nr:hypothetical protein H0H81_009036 [Sphagnurus paluster]